MKISNNTSHAPVWNLSVIILNKMTLNHTHSLLKSQEKLTPKTFILK